MTEGARKSERTPAEAGLRETRARRHPPIEPGPGRPSTPTRCRGAAGALLAGALFGATAVACGGEGPGEVAWEGRIDTLAGGGVRVVNPQSGIWTDETRWHLTEELRIGSLESEGPHLFGQVVDVAVDGQGRLYVLESQAHELRVFSPDGSHLYTVGGHGEGPGELNIPFGGAVYVEPAGRIWINNSMNRRWELYSPAGEHLSSVAQRGSFFGGTTVMAEDGTMYERSRIRPPEGEARSVVFVREPRGDSLVTTDTLEVPEMPEAETVQASLTAESGAQMTMRMPVPFVHQPSWSVDPRGFFWVEPGNGYRLVALSAESHDTLRIVEREHEPVPVTEEEIRKALEPYETGALAGSGADMDRSRIPEHHPPLGTFRPDEAGNLWVRRPLGQERYTWDVFDPDGVYLGEVTSDVDLSELTVHVITEDAVYGVVRDELDVPYVVRLAIRRGTPPGA